MVNVIPLTRYVRYCRWPGCNSEPGDDMQIPLCERHFVHIGERFMDQRSIIGSAHLAATKDEREARKEPIRRDAEARDRWLASRSVVYYARIGEHVKIGYTSHLPSRIVQLRLDSTAVLAVEPGSREEESERHIMFAAERQGRREDFNPSRRLMAHIDVVRSKYGEPWAYSQRRIKAAGALAV